MHNSGAMLFGAFVLIITWFGLSDGQKWSFWTLLIAGVIVQGMGFLSDSILGNRTIVVNAVLTALFLAGIALSGYGLLKLI